MNRTLIEQLVTKHEGRRAAVYTDTDGKLTIGIGLNLDAAGSRELCQGCGLDFDALCSGAATLTDAEIDELFETQLNAAIYGAQCQVPGFDTLPDAAQAVVVDMVFNLGAGGFAKFVQLRAALEAKDFAAAAQQVTDSLWCGQVGTRCSDNAGMLEAL